MTKWVIIAEERALNAGHMSTWGPFKRRKALRILREHAKLMAGKGYPVKKQLSGLAPWVEYQPSEGGATRYQMDILIAKCDPGIEFSGENPPEEEHRIPENGEVEPGVNYPWDTR